jgi:hypothetical protein
LSARHDGDACPSHRFLKTDARSVKTFQRDERRLGWRGSQLLTIKPEDGFILALEA